jgi:transglutaminase-like putative cysteine protease/Flp pilus assembly pilin Flp
MSQVVMDRRTFLRVTGLSLAGVAGAVCLTEGSPSGATVAAQTALDPITALAAELGYDREAILRFVAEEVAYEPYEGVLRGPRVTLAGRAGNSADKVLLLAELLAASLIETRFVLGVLDIATAQALAGTRADPAAIRRRRATVLSSGARRGQVGQVPPRVQAVVDRLGEIDASATSWAAATLDGTTRMIVEALAEAGVTLPADEPAADLPGRTPHVWLQARAGADWIDLDPTLRGVVSGHLIATPTVEPMASVPDDLRHRIDITLTVERIVGGALDEEVILEQSLFADAMSGAPMMMGHARPEGLQAVGVALTEALTGDIRYQAVLRIDDTTFIGTSGIVVAGGDGGVIDVGDGPTREGEATAEWLDVAITAPGGRTRRARRTLFDRVGEPARRAATFDPTSIADVQLVPLGPDGSDEFPPLCAVHFIAIATGASPRPTVPERSTDDERLISALGIPASAYHVTRDTLSATLTLDRGVAVHLDSPNVTLHSYVPVVEGAGTVRVREALDLLHRGFGTLPVVGADAHPPAAVLAGVASHVAERLRMGEGLPADLLVNSAPMGPGAIIERAIREGTGLRVDRGQLPTDASGPVEALGHLRAALEDGWVAIGPRDPVIIDGLPRLGWWLVDPVTGATVDLADDGRGVTMVEWATIVVVVAVAAVVGYICLSRASSAAAWNAWVVEMQGMGDQLGVDLGDLPMEDGGACA